MAHTKAEIFAAGLFLIAMGLIFGAVIWLGFAIHPALGAISIGMFLAVAALFIIKGERS